MKTQHNKLIIITALGLIIIGVAFIVIYFSSKTNTSNTPKPIVPLENNSQQGTPTTIVSPSGKLTVDNLVQNQFVPLPMIVTGTVQGWFFEGSFPVIMRDVGGNQIGVALANSSQDWMTANPIPFSVTLPVTNYTGQGSLVFTKDNPTGEAQFDDSYVVNVVF
jgi:hypothetical protein